MNKAMAVLLVSKRHKENIHNAYSFILYISQKEKEEQKEEKVSKDAN